MKYKVTTPPNSEPISLAEAKLHLRVDTTDDDVLISSLVKAAREYCEKFQNRSYVAQVVTLKLDQFTASDYIELPLAPLISVSSISYVDNNGATQTFSSSNYSVDVFSEPGRITLGYNKTWPSDCRGYYDDLTITYVAGYANTFTAVAGTDVLTAGNKTFADGDELRLFTTDNDLPAPLALNTKYYARDSSGSTCKLAASSGGAALDITDAGSGTHFFDAIPEAIRQAIKLLIGHLYEHREDATELKLTEMPLGVKSLLWQDRLGAV